eukprot:4208738-Prymnesium_polylepis.1
MRVTRWPRGGPHEAMWGSHGVTWGGGDVATTNIPGDAACALSRTHLAHALRKLLPEYLQRREASSCGSRAWAQRVLLLLRAMAGCDRQSMGTA